MIHKVLLIFGIFLTVVIPNVYPTRSCIDPPDVELRMRSTPFSSQTHVTGLIGSGSAGIRGNANINRSDMQLNISRDDAYEMDMERAACPWEYVRNYDPNRRPEVLLEARCRFRGCGNRTSGCTCHCVYIYVNVLHKTRCDVTSGWNVYDPSIERLCVGCVCEQEPSSIELNRNPSSHTRN